jgi:hypothetical protein
MKNVLQQSLIFLVPIVFFGGLGAVIGSWIQRHLRRRKLRAMGFKPEDLKSRGTELKKFGELLQARLPERIEFKPVESYSWSDKIKYGGCERALERHGFERLGTFVASPENWVAEFWVSESLKSCGAIIDIKLHGPYIDMMTWYEDGTHSSFSNCPNTGLCAAEEQHVHCGYIDPEELIARELRERPAKEIRVTGRENVVQAYEIAINGHLAMQRKVGFTADQMRRHFESRSQITKAK